MPSGIASPQVTKELNEMNVRVNQIQRTCSLRIRLLVSSKQNLFFSLAKHTHTHTHTHIQWQLLFALTEIFTLKVMSEWRKFEKTLRLTYFLTLFFPGKKKIPGIL